MDASPKSVKRKEKKSNPVIRNERKREVPIHEAPVQEAPLHEAPSVDGAQDPPGDLQVGVDDHHAPTEEVMHENLTGATM